MPTVTLNTKGIVAGGGVFPLVGIPAAVTFTPNGANVDAAQIISLQATPSQVLNTTLSNQPTILRVFTKEIQIPELDPGGIASAPPIYKRIFPIFMDVYLNDNLIIGGVLCHDRNLIIRNTYLGFIGDFSFIDLVGKNDPEYQELGSRYILGYWPNLK